MKKILVVDDESGMCVMIKTILENEKFSVQTANSGEEALGRIIDDPPDIILLDLLMPGMDGRELLKKIKNSEQTRHIKVIMVTANGDKKSKIRGLELGVNDYIVKPFHPDELLARVQSQAQVIGIEEKLVANERLKTILKMGRTIGHELNNPLTSILGNTELLMKEVDSTEHKEMLNMIRGESLRIRDLVKKIMDITNPVDTDYLGTVNMVDISKSVR